MFHTMMFGFLSSSAEDEPSRRILKPYITFRPCFFLRHGLLCASLDVYAMGACIGKDILGKGKCTARCAFQTPIPRRLSDDPALIYLYQDCVTPLPSKPIILRAPFGQQWAEYHR